MGGHFGFAGAKLLHANRGQLPPPRSIWVIPGSRGVFGIEEVGVGPLMSDFFFTEFSNRALRGNSKGKKNLEHIHSQKSLKMAEINYTYLNIYKEKCLPHMNFKFLCSYGNKIH